MASPLRSPTAGDRISMAVMGVASSLGSQHVERVSSRESLVSLGSGEGKGASGFAGSLSGATGSAGAECEFLTEARLVSAVKGSVVSAQEGSESGYEGSVLKGLAAGAEVVVVDFAQGSGPVSTGLVSG